MRSVMDRTGAYACAAVVFALTAAVGTASLLPGVASATMGVLPDTKNFPCNTTTPCVAAINSATGAGIKGSSNKGIGVFGTSTKAFAVEGVSGNGATGGVEGLGTTGFGLFGKSASGIATYAQSSSGYGLEAISDTNDAVHAINTQTGTAVAAQATNGNAIVATTANGFALYANATSGTGAYIIGPRALLLKAAVGAGSYAIAAVDSNSRNTFVVSGDGNVISGATSGTGIDSSTASGLGAYIHSGSGDGAHIVSTGGNGAVIVSNGGNGADISGSLSGIITRSPAGIFNYPLIATDSAGNNVFYVNGNGDVYYHGTLNPFANTRSGQRAIAFASTTTSPTMEDVGSAQLVNGQALVRLDSTFAQAIDLRAPYHIFLTPDGDTRGLYVASKRPDGFVVRETQSGRGTFAFDYRIVASALGRAGERMALVGPSQEMTIPHVPLAKRHILPTPKAPAVNPRANNSIR